MKTGSSPGSGSGRQCGLGTPPCGAMAGTQAGCSRPQKSTGTRRGECLVPPLPPGQDSTASRNKRERQSLDTARRLLTSNNYLPWEVPIWLSYLVSLGLENPQGCPNHGQPSTHSKVRVCSFCKREVGRGAGGAPASTSGLVEGTPHLPSHLPAGEEDHGLLLGLNPSL